MAAKKSFGKKKSLPTDVALQITSMADIFMILLVFLLKNYAVSMTNIAPTAHMTLPEVEKAQGQVKESLKVEIAADTVLVDQKLAVRLNRFQFDANEMGDNGVSPSVLKILKDQRTLMPEPNLDSALVVMADQKTPYSTLKRVVASAAQAGFVDLQLVVVSNE
ncbi:MAG: hypothetical protein C5B49_09200 [Bdellovibrio sp.]|nr:MAG: hypothetical protein C5B49_09200 [Bdellovibrio sp.]